MGKRWNNPQHVVHESYSEYWWRRNRWKFVLFAGLLAIVVILIFSLDMYSSYGINPLSGIMEDKDAGVTTKEEITEMSNDIMENAKIVDLDISGTTSNSIFQGYVESSADEKIYNTTVVIIIYSKWTKREIKRAQQNIGTIEPFGKKEFYISIKERNDNYGNVEMHLIGDLKSFDK